MDYDDNEFQSQDIEPLSDDNTKFPSGLRSYTLPKFDLDEPLHVRFDSLGEAGVLLGIQNQTEDHWIEAFPRGNSGIVLDPVSQGIEFSSGTAESCPISRHNDVWSEATSSESVEMLLNSVKQDEVITKTHIVDESDACDKLGILENKMDTTLSCDDSSPSNLGVVLDADPTDGGKHPKMIAVDTLENAAHFGSLMETCNEEKFKDETSTGEGTTYDCKNGDHFENVRTVGESSVKNVQPDSLYPNLTDVHGEIGTKEQQKDDVPKDDQREKPTGIHSVDSANGAGTSCLVSKADSPNKQKTQEEEVPVCLNDSHTSTSNDIVVREQMRSECLENISGADFIPNIPETIVTGHSLRSSEMHDLSGVAVDVSNSMHEKALEMFDRREADVGIGAVVGITHLDAVVRERGSALMSSKVIEGVDDDGGRAYNEGRSGQCEIEMANPLISQKSETDIISTVSGRVIDGFISKSSGAVGGLSETARDSATDKTSEEVQLMVPEKINISDKDPLEKQEVGSSRSHNVGKEINGKAQESSPIPGPPNLQGDDVRQQIQHCDGTEPPDSVAAQFSCPVQNSSIIECQSEFKSTEANTDTQENESEKQGASVINAEIVEEKDGPRISAESSLGLHEETSPEPLGKATTCAEVSDKGQGIHEKHESNPTVAKYSNFSILSTSTEGNVVSATCSAVVEAQSELQVESGGSSGAGLTNLVLAAGVKPTDVKARSSEPDNAMNAEAKELEDGIDIGASLERDCGSPIVISSNEPCHSEMECQEGDKEYLDQNARLSGDTPGVSNRVDRQGSKNELNSQNAGENDALETDKSFTFELGSLASRETNSPMSISGSFVTDTNGKGWKPFPSVQPVDSYQTEKVSQVTPLPSQTEHKVSDGNSRGKLPISEGQKGSKVSKESNVTVDGSALRSKIEKSEGQPVKSTTTLKKAPPSTPAKSVGEAFSRSVQVEEVPRHASLEGSSTKLSCVTTVQASNLPDLNALAVPASALFQQPFTDSQQVQLRAQIFVYGSLIQGLAPDEACMISAFADSGRDGGRGVWENVWRTAVERCQNQKSPSNNLETPLSARSGFRPNELVSRSPILQNKALGTPAGRSTSKSSPPSSILTPSVSLSSPVWNISAPSREGLQATNLPRAQHMDPIQTIPAMHLYQSPHIRHFVGSPSPWSTQSPSPGSWLVPSQTSNVDCAVQYPTVESIQMTPPRDLPSGARSQAVHLAPPSPLGPTAASALVTSTTSISSEARRKTANSLKNTPQEPKSRKKKKGSVPDSPIQVSIAELGADTSVTKQLPFAMASPPLPSIVSTKPPVSKASCAPTSSPVLPTNFQVLSGGNNEQRVTLSEETSTRLEQAKQQAEEASAQAASAVRHSQGIWNQLGVQKSLALVSDAEVKVASAAVAAAAAASVAKAAAAAAKVACEAALQAKLMADEALTANKTGNVEIGLPESKKNSKGKKASTSSSIIALAREAARKRVEAASAAAKRAENLDAVVKAAELAAEAVSQAGAVIAMGDPIPLTLRELFEAGPDGYWKLQNPSGDFTKKAANLQIECGGSAEILNEQVSGKDGLGQDKEGSAPSGEELSGQAVEKQGEVGNGVHQNAATVENGFGGQWRRKNLDVSKTLRVAPELQSDSRVVSSAMKSADAERPLKLPALKENNIKEGSLVEVVSDEEGLRGVWFSAKVQSIKDGKAFICYTELLNDEGSDHLKEWITLESESDKPPRVRLAHPVTALKFEGTRKRRRAAMGNYVWTVGDRVDVWMRDGWWEGIVTEKFKEDESKLSVHFPAEGDSSVVKTWNLRPSLVWKDSHWVEWSHSNEDEQWTKEDVTQIREKRQKLGHPELDPETEARGTEKAPNYLYTEDPKKPQNLRSLPLSAKDKLFDVGKSSREGNPSGEMRVKRKGLQKEGSKVVFGVPKPGKKRKFMDVSKHYVSERSGKLPERNDSVKFLKYLIPQGSRGATRGSSKVDVKAKQAVDPKSKEVKIEKAQRIPNRNRSEKNGSSLSTSTETTSVDPLLNSRGPLTTDNNNKVDKQQTPEVGSLPNVTRDVPVLFSSMEHSLQAPSRSKSSTIMEREQVPKGKHLPSADKLNAEEDKSADASAHGKPASDLEPRRSNRRIQPTSRLLEGLQSTPSIPKAPTTASHDRGHKNHNRPASSSLKGTGHG
ncbi:hypothetical protein AMTRI_Chr13g116350 [Amborella trichopoda]